MDKSADVLEPLNEVENKAINDEKINGFDLINISTELESEFNNHLLDFDGTNLSLCCSDELFNPLIDLEYDNIKSKIMLDSTVLLQNGIRIGMDKKELLDKFFIYSEKIAFSLAQISVCEDERGELYTKYKFVDRKLTEIEFASLDEE
ncbi:hypothetical protein FEE95_21750 [Maribacter algarum]|uniref:Uncharacterized protein n=1 Tax=Maribacter algarum (ex Zhang et al. 2020) TaxID=2578118 RepID=A0A5S3PHV4_9FLAO|nr:hypothetical protein [Maribacter algarum]TMM51515.1 hypothetical protein FEE95_21750 [Maribacter algarum]